MGRQCPEILIAVKFFLALVEDLNPNTFQIDTFFLFCDISQFYQLSSYW